MAVNASWPGVSRKVIASPEARCHLVSADMLGNAAGLAAATLVWRMRVQQGGLAVVHMAHAMVTTGGPRLPDRHRCLSVALQANLPRRVGNPADRWPDS